MMRVNIAKQGFQMLMRYWQKFVSVEWSFDIVFGVLTSGESRVVESRISLSLLSPHNILQLLKLAQCKCTRHPVAQTFCSPIVQ